MFSSDSSWFSGGLPDADREYRKTALVEVFWTLFRWTSILDSFGGLNEPFGWNGRGPFIGRFGWTVDVF